MSEYILEIKNLRKVFDSDLFKEKVEAIKNISCRFPEGSATAVIGHNGAGKTTTIRTLLGLLKPTEGEILYKGSPITKEDRSNIGYMPEVHRLTGALTPKETLAIHLKFFAHIPKRDHEELVEKALKRVGLEDHKGKYLKNLSKGLQRRLAFALATIHSPKLLILDEPFSGLDPLAHGHMEKWIREEKSRGATIIMSSHQVSSIVKTCDFFHVILNGEIAYSSVDESNLEKSTSGYTIEVSGIDQNSLTGLFDHTGVNPPSAWHNTDFQHTLAYETYTDASSAMKALLEEGALITKFAEASNLSETLILSMLQKGGK